MLTRQNAVFAALQRAQRFFDENGVQLTSTVDLTAARKRLDDVIASFSTHAVDQSTTNRTVKGENAKQQQLRATLTADIMRPIAEIARRNLRTVPEFKSLRMPRHVGGPAFLADATGMAKAAAIHKATLIERGMPADFLDQFQAGIEQLAQSVSDRDQSLTHRIGATKGLHFQEQEGRSVLKVLDALVRRALRDNHALLGTWAGARAIYRQPRTAPTPVPTTQIPTTQTAPASPATPPVAAA